MLVAAWIVLGFGTLLTALNIYLGFIRYPLFRLRGGRADQFHFVSGFLIVGSAALCLVAWLFRSEGHSSAMWLALCVAAFDIGGLHWFCLMVGWHWCRQPKTG